MRFSPHWSLNSSKGVIFANHLNNDTEEDLEIHLKSQGVVEVKQMKTKRNGLLIPTNGFILTFNSPKLPTHVKVAYMNCKVKPYIPQPVRCFQCQKLGHHTKKCYQQTPTCSKCSLEVTDSHNNENCPYKQKCVNCKGQHPSSSKECPEWKKIEKSS